MYARKFKMRIRCLSVVAIMLGFTIQAALSQGFVGRNKLTAHMVEMLKHPTEMEVYSLGSKTMNANPDFNDFKVFGHTAVTSQHALNAIGQHLIEKTDPGSVHYCGFNPHHGVSVLSRGHRLDYVICFQCGDVRIFLDREYWNHGTLTSPDTSFEVLLNKTLQEKKILLSANYLRDFADRQKRKSAAVPRSGSGRK